jgi:hypothetical protein
MGVSREYLRCLCYPLRGSNVSGIYVCMEMYQMYHMHKIVEKHFSISIAPVRSRGGSLVAGNIKLYEQLDMLALIVKYAYSNSQITAKLIRLKDQLKKFDSLYSLTYGQQNVTLSTCNSKLVVMPLK